MNSLTVKKKINLILFLIIGALALVNGTTYSYWASSIEASNSTTNGIISIGDWEIPSFTITVNNNHGDFETFSFNVDPYVELGTDKYDEYFNGFIPDVKDHSGVNQSLYSFDDFYLEDGTKITSSTVINSDITVYPSWNTTLFNYSKPAGMNYYNLSKPSAVTYSGDLYVPGWRYKGMTINQVGIMSTQTNPLVVDGLWVGDGIKSITTNGFRYANASSLYLGEGLEVIGGQAFANTHIFGDLIMPSTIITINNWAFHSSKLDGTLDLSNSNALTVIGDSAFHSVKFIGSLEFGTGIEEIGQHAFNLNGFTGSLDLSNSNNLVFIGNSAFSGVKFTGSLVLGESLTTIQNGAFNNGNFDGTLDLTNAISLETIGTHAFNNNNFTGTLYMGPNVTTISASSFSNNKFETLDLSDASSLESIGSNAFSNNLLENLIFPTNSSLKTIGSQSFQTN